MFQEGLSLGWNEYRHWSVLELLDSHFCLHGFARHGEPGNGAGFGKIGQNKTGTGGVL